MRAYIVLKPTEDESAQIIELEAVKVVETYQKTPIADMPYPRISGDEDEPERFFLDTRNINELLDITGYLTDYTNWERIRRNIRTWSDDTSAKPTTGNKQGATCDVFLTSNYQDDGVTAPVLKTTYVSSLPWATDSGPNKEYLNWNFLVRTDTTATFKNLDHASNSGGGFIMRAMATYQPEDTDEEDYPLKYGLQLTLRRGKRLAGEAITVGA